MKNIKKTIIQSLEKIVAEIVGESVSVQLEIPQEASHGDFATNIALIVFGNQESRIKNQEYKNPLELAEKIVQKLQITNKESLITKIEVAKPGFINFWISRDQLITNLDQLLSDKKKPAKTGKSQKVMLEFAHPNTHKEFHIGHLRNITLGESIARLSEFNGATIKRVNYQGDVGMHVAKAIFGIKNLGLEKADNLSLEEKAKFLGKAYALGSKFYEEDAAAKEEIGIINKQIYARDPAVLALWEKTRQWSLDYFNWIYKRLDTKFDRFYFESQVYESGKETVLYHIRDGVFVKENGAIIFPGEKYGLHTRVFVTSEGNPTYEGKEMGLGPLQYKENHFDKAIHLVGPEQAGYFTVVFKALELINPVFKDREFHLSYGFVKLKEGKMSSRMGNVVSGVWLLDEAKKRIKEEFKDMDEVTVEHVAVGAVKYSMLKFGRESDISFSFEESISLQGNSGPYLQYTYARTHSVLAKVKRYELSGKSLELNPEEELLLRKLFQFDGIVEQAAEHFAPNILCNYLFEMTQLFNNFYQKHKIIGSSNEQFRLDLTAGVGSVIKHGLQLLGIQAPKKM